MALHDLVEGLIHALRYREVRPHLRTCGLMVDLGCGREHRFLKRFHAVAEKCWGLDISASDSQEGNIVIRRGDITTRLPFEDASVDQATCLAVLEHIRDPLPILRECRRVLRPGGRLILTTPTRSGIRVHEMMRKLRLVRDVEEGEHQDFAMSGPKLSEWVRRAGMEVETARGFEFGMNLLLVARRP